MNEHGTAHCPQCTQRRAIARSTNTSFARRACPSRPHQRQRYRCRQYYHLQTHCGTDALRRTTRSRRTVRQSAPPPRRIRPCRPYRRPPLTMTTTTMTTMTTTQTRARASGAAGDRPAPACVCARCRRRLMSGAGADSAGWTGRTGATACGGRRHGALTTGSQSLSHGVHSGSERTPTTTEHYSMTQREEILPPRLRPRLRSRPRWQPVSSRSTMTATANGYSLRRHRRHCRHQTRHYHCCLRQKSQRALRSRPKKTPATFDARVTAWRCGAWSASVMRAVHQRQK
jgi:hypothetical protein